MASKRILTNTVLCRSISYESTFNHPIGTSLEQCRNSHNTSDSIFPSQDKGKRVRTPLDWVSGGSSKFPKDWTCRGTFKTPDDWVSGSSRDLDVIIRTIARAARRTLESSSTPALHLSTDSSSSSVESNDLGCGHPSKCFSRIYSTRSGHVKRSVEPLGLGYQPGSRKYSTYSRQISSPDYAQIQEESPDFTRFQRTQSCLETTNSLGVRHYSTDSTGSSDTDSSIRSNQNQNADIPNQIDRISEPLKWSYLSVEGNKPLLGMTLGQALDRAGDLFGDRDAVVSMHQGIRKSFTDLQKDSADVAAGLLAVGLSPGDRLGIWSPNNYEWVVTQFAAAKAGLVLVNINPSYRPNELEFCLQKVAVKGIICASSFRTSNYYKMLCDVAPELSTTASGSLLSSKSLPHLTNVIMIGEQNMPSVGRG